MSTSDDHGCGKSDVGQSGMDLSVQVTQEKRLPWRSL